MNRLHLFARAWRTDVPRVVLFLQAGNAFSWFGYGLILPLEIIYLHQFRGFLTATAGLVLGAILGAGTVATPPSGALLDRFRALQSPHDGLEPSTPYHFVVRATIRNCRRRNRLG